MRTSTTPNPTAKRAISPERSTMKAKPKAKAKSKDEPAPAPKAKFGVITTTKPRQPKASIQGIDKKTGKPLVNQNNIAHFGVISTTGAAPPRAKFGVISTTKPRTPRPVVGADDRGGQNEWVRTVQKAVRRGTATREYSDRMAAGSKGPVWGKESFDPPPPYRTNIQYAKGGKKPKAAPRKRWT